MECKDVRRKLEDYIDEKCSVEEEEVIEKHLEGCTDCQRIVDEQLQTEGGSKVPFHKEALDEAWRKEVDGLKQERWMKKAKWKHRITTAVNMFFLFLVICIVSALLTSGYYLITGKGKEAGQVVQTATQMTMPNVYASRANINSNIFFTLDIEMNLQRTLGKEEQKLGDLNGRMLFNLLNVERDWTDGQYDVKLYFMHPEFVAAQSQMEQEFYGETTNDTWTTLDMLPEGTVAELAISFDDSYEIDDIYPFFEGYDLDIVWYAVDTGTEHRGTRHGSPYISANEIWGFHEWSVFDLQMGSGSGSLSIQTRGDGEKRAEVFKDGIELLLDNERMTRRYLRHRELNLQERFDYVSEHGAKTYGVVVTGPTKELLRLRELDEIIYGTLGEVDLWNWYNRPARGRIYN
ncbi:MAG: anti-sigma factor [Bacillus sp. (in: Bacteria)]|nr:anti-sigma factor [Bacillus sp. (in: firmicutes)]